MTGLVETGAKEEGKSCSVAGGQRCVWEDGVCGKVVKL